MKKQNLLVTVVYFSLIVIFMVLPVISFTAPVPSKAKTLKIGMITSITGVLSPAFKTMYDTVKPTEDLLNQMGGVTVNGQKYRIEIIVEDDQSSPPGAVTAANKLIQAGVKFIVAPVFMPSGLATAPIFEKEKILRIKTFGNGPEECNAQLRYAFFSCSSMYNIEPCLDYLVKTYPKAKRIALLPPDDPGAVSLVTLAKKEVEKHGLKMVFSEPFRIGTEDFYPILTKALQQKPDAIFMVISIAPWAAGIINQSCELGFTGPIFGSNPLGDINILKSMLNPKYAHDIFHAAPDVTSDKMLPIVKDLRKLVEQTNNPFTLDSVLDLDALYPMLQCIESAQSFDTDKVVDMIDNNKMKSIDTVWGKGKWGGIDFFGNNHVIIRPITFSRLENGKVEFWFGGK